MPQRIVACQGPIQLVTAVAVLRQRDREVAQTSDPVWDDHLIIMELAAPVGQEASFVKALERMAAALRPWKSVSYMPQPHGLERFDEVGEVFVVREWQAGNQALLAAFPRAVKICFGDSIGIYLAPTYMAPRPSLLRRAATALRRKPVLKPGASADCYYLALPDAFDPAPSRNVKPTDISLLRRTLEDLMPLVPRELLAELRARLGRRRLVVIVTSNFSEQGVMSTSVETAAYMEFIDAQGLDREALVLLKPHPRDRREKAEKIEEELKKRFTHVFTLSDAVASYLPLEVLMLEIRPAAESHLGIEICTFSSACLAAKHVLGIQPRIGFGARAVARHFAKPYIKPRLCHERQLHEACGA
jgi:hypothetical protein